MKQAAPEGNFLVHHIKIDFAFIDLRGRAVKVEKRNINLLIG